MAAVGKILAVFVAVASVGFAALVVSMTYGGVNWRAEMKSDTLTTEFSLAETKNPVKYSVKQRSNDADVASSENLAEVVVKARDKQLQNLKAEIQPLQDQLTKAKADIEAWKPQMAADREGLAKREATLQAQVEAVQAEISKLNGVLTERAAKAQALQTLAQTRREEVFRLRNQVELLRTDLYAVVQQRGVLEQELVRMQENVRRLSRRQQQLLQQVNPQAYEPADNE